MDEEEMIQGANPHKVGKEKSKRKLLVAITLIVVAILLTAYIVMAFFNGVSPAGVSPVVGKWHLTKEEHILYNGTNITYFIDKYIVFNESGTGFYYFNSYPLGSQKKSFTWKDLGNNKLNITYGRNSSTYLYIVNGNKIELEHTEPQGLKFIMYGERVQSIPSPQGGWLFGSLVLNKDSSNISKGWINMSLELNNPKSMEPSDITLKVNDTLLHYSEEITGDKQWSFLDLDGNKKVSDGDIIVIHFTGIKSGEYINLTCKGYSGYIYSPIYKGVLYGSLNYDASSSDIAEGWVNITLVLDKPSELNPANVHIQIENKLELNYVNEINGNNQWSFEDLDGSGELSNGDIIVIHSTSISDGDTIKLTCNFYEASFEVIIP